MSRDRRCRATCPAQILVPELAPAPAIAIDLCVGGIFLETNSALPLGLRVKVRLLPEHGPAIVVAGRILRTGYREKRVAHPELDHLSVRASGLAVKFDPLQGETAEAMRAYLETLEET